MALDKKRKLRRRDVKTYDIFVQERDTYDSKERKEKEKITNRVIEKHWDMRAQRQGVQAVMSARHTLRENKKATLNLQRDIFKFLKGLVENKIIFELGAGIGRMTGELARHAKKVVGVDISPIMLAKARKKLAKCNNIQLFLGRVTDLQLAPKSFDLVFDSIVLLHILNPKELKATIAKMLELSNRIFIVEHTYEGPDFPISKYSILRKPGEYAKLFRPYKLVKQKTHLCAGDTFTMMLFENPII